MKKVAIVMAAGGAAGKSTATKAFAIGDPQEFKDKRIVWTSKGDAEGTVNWTLYDNCAVAGNHHSGTDANTGPGRVIEAFNECLEYRDIAIVDGMISTPRWVLMCNRWQDEHPDDELFVLCLHFNLEAEELLNRLAGRRGVDKETIRERMEPRCVALVRRAQVLVNHFHDKCECEWKLLEIDKFYAPDDIVELLDDEVCKILECEEMTT